jgi:hypothetical protein
MTATTGEIPLLNGKASVYPRLLLFKKADRHRSSATSVQALPFEAAGVDRTGRVDDGDVG